jgi:hypothetical protein
LFSYSHQLLAVAPNWISCVYVGWLHVGCLFSLENKTYAWRIL